MPPRVPSFPPNRYEHFFREHQYGMATQNFAQWFREELIGLSVTLVAGAILLIALYAVFRRAPRTCWIWGTIVAVIFSSIGNFIAPLYVEPLFNTYKPLEDPAIRNPILAMARANGIPLTQVIHVDASPHTPKQTANGAGFLGAARVAPKQQRLKQ